MGFFKSLFRLTTVWVVLQLLLSAGLFAFLMIGSQNWFFYGDFPPFWFFCISAVLASILFFGIRYLLIKKK